ncbi:MAG: signal recognition particle protein, partial [Erysipelotrichaceae bacterium]
IVRDEIIELLGDGESSLNYASNGLTVVMMVGLQGTGKTTSAAKIANLIAKKQARKPLLIAADLVRPAAVEQLKTLAQQCQIEAYSLDNNTKATKTVSEGLKYAKENSFDTVIIDTAGRLHVDKQLMNELVEIKKIAKPNDILLTVDALTGQDIVNVAKEFDNYLSISGLVVTKFDGDSRGGGVLSVKAVTNVPVKFVGTGEKIEDIDIFYPDRMASRILGMGDLETLVEKAQEQFDQELAQRAMENMMNGTFSLDDMLVQMKQLKKLGPLSGVMKMIPGMNQFAGQLDGMDTEAMMKKQQAIIQSMTPYERKHPETLRSSHKNRIAKGSGTTVNDVNKLINSFERSKKLMASMGLSRFKF